MKQKLLSILTLLVLCVTGAWGDTEITFSPTNKTQTQSNVTVSSSNNVPSELKIANVEKTNGWKIDSNPVSIVSTSANITKIVFVGCTNSGASSGSEVCGDIKTSSDGSSYSTITSGVTIKDADATDQTNGTGFSMVKNGVSPATTVTVTFSNSQRYVQIAKAASNGKQMNLSSIKVYIAASDPVDPTITFSNGSYNVGDAALDLSTLFESNSSGAVTYSVTDANGTGATIDGPSFTATTTGTATVRASQAEATGYNAKTAEATITVTNLSTPTFTVTSATNYIIGNSLSLSSLITDNTSDGTVTYTVKDAGTTSASISDGVFSATAAGTAVVTIAVPATSTYKAVSADVTITVSTNPLGSHTLTWNIATVSGSSESNITATSDIGTSSTNSTSTYITSLTDLTGTTGAQRTTSGKNGNTGKIETPESYDADKYVSMTFTVANGYKFTPSSVSIKTVAVVTAKDLKFELSDANGSYSVTKTGLSTNATAATNTLDFSGCTTSFTGTVTAKIYVYGATDAYRLSTPLEISGTVEEYTGKTALTGAWTDAAPSFNVGDEASESIPTFSVNGGATIDTDYTVAYSKVAGDDLATFTDAGGITAINTAASGTETIRATVTLTNTKDYSIATTTYDCVITVEKVAAGLSYKTTAVTKRGNANYTNELTNPNNLSVTYAITNNGTGSTINASTGQVTIGNIPGTETITASSDATDAYLAGEATYTLTIYAETGVAGNADDLVAYSPGDVFIADNITENGYIGLTAGYLYGESHIYSPNGNSVARNKGKSTIGGVEHYNSLRVKSSSQDPLAFKVDRPCVITFYAQTTGKTGNEVRTIKVGNAVDDSTYGTISDANETHTVTIPAAGVVYLTGTGDRFIAGFEVSALTVPVTVAASGYTSLASSYPLDFANAEDDAHNKNLTAFVISSITSSSVTLTSVENAPAATGLILKGTASTAYTIPTAESPAAIASNELSAAVTATDVEANTVYVVSGGVLKLFSGTTIPAGKAYLLKSKVPNTAQNLSFVFDETTGISNIEDNRTILSGDFYNIAGQRVEKPGKGIYIVNGRKVVVK